jgi:hypothetical protein
MISLEFTQGRPSSFIFVNDAPIAGEAWEITSLVDEDGVNVGLGINGAALDYPVPLLPYGVIPGTYYSPKIRVDSAGKFAGILTRTGTADKIVIALNVLPVAAASSDPADPVEPGEQVVEDASRVKARIVFSDITGTAVVNREVYFCPIGNPVNVGSILAVGNSATIMPETVIAKTNVQGYAEIYLIKGMRVRVSLEGSYMVRDITVPDVDFNIVTEMANAPDFLTVVVPEYTNVIRGI